MFNIKAYDGEPSFWIGLYLDSTLSSKICVLDGEKPEDLHITLFYAGLLEDFSSQSVLAAKLAIHQVCKNFKPLKGKIAGYGRFKDFNTGKDVFYLSPDVPGLFEFRSALCDSLSKLGILNSPEHGFTPHITLKFLPSLEPNPLVSLDSNIEIILDSVSVFDKQTVFILGDENTMVTRKNSDTDSMEDFEDVYDEEEDLENPDFDDLEDDWDDIEDDFDDDDEDEAGWDDFDDEDEYDDDDDLEEMDDDDDFYEEDDEF